MLADATPVPNGAFGREASGQNPGAGAKTKTVTVCPALSGELINYTDPVSNRWIYVLIILFRIHIE
jgi:hypothetical protein